MYKYFYNPLIIIFAIILMGTFTIAQKNNGKNKVAKSANDICPLLVGEKIPDLVLTDIESQAFDLNKALQKKPAILVIYTVQIIHCVICIMITQ